jgi:hypothetical protein
MTVDTASPPTPAEVEARISELRSADETTSPEVAIGRWRDLFLSALTPAVPQWMRLDALHGFLAAKSRLSTLAVTQ